MNDNTIRSILIDRGQLLNLEEQILCIVINRRPKNDDLACFFKIDGILELWPAKQSCLHFEPLDNLHLSV